ncbi:MAG: aminomethyltransferase beta-barrel domain-containing protein, partial [Phenylobacterium sp.]
REALATRAVSLKEANWLGDETGLDAAAAAGRSVLARVRSTAEPVIARLAVEAGEPRVVFAEPEYGVSPGQACVLYAPEDPDRVLGGGFIASALK